MILGTISSYTDGTGVKVTIDGESSATTKKYLFLSSYVPHIGDRVLIAEISDSYVVLGKVANTPATVELAQKSRASTNRVSDPDTGDVIFGISGGRLYYGLKVSEDISATMYKVANA